MKGLARRWRPRRWHGPQGLLGQDVLVRTLSSAILSGRVAAAYLLWGPRGTGKTTSARVLAAALNCERRQADDPNPCGQCGSCQAILDGRDTGDVVELDAASHRGVDDARQLRQMASLAGLRPGAWRVFILDECHMLTREAWATLLKVIEEPPPQTVFILCTTDPEKIEQAAEAILSRVQRLQLRLVGPAEMEGHLQRVASSEAFVLEPAAARLLTEAAGGSVRDALSRLDAAWTLAEDSRGVTAEVVRQALGLPSETLLGGVLTLLEKNRQDKIAALIVRLETEGLDPVAFYGQLERVLIDLLLLLDHGEGRQEVMARWNADTVARAQRLLASQPPALVRGRVGEGLRVLAHDVAVATQVVRPAWLLFATIQRLCDVCNPPRAQGPAGDGAQT